MSNFSDDDRTDGEAAPAEHITAAEEGHEPVLGHGVEEDQLQPEDSLMDLGEDDVLDEGYSPPAATPERMRLDYDPADEYAEESLDDRLAEEEPDVAEIAKDERDAINSSSAPAEDTGDEVEY